MIMMVLTLSVIPPFQLKLISMHAKYEKLYVLQIKIDNSRVLKFQFLQFSRLHISLFRSHCLRFQALHFTNNKTNKQTM